MKTINLNDAKIGDILISKHGSILEYIGLNSPPYNYYPHKVRFLLKDGKINEGEIGEGSRNDDGTVMKKNRRHEDEDIIAIIDKNNFSTIIKNI